MDSVKRIAKSVQCRECAQLMEQTRTGTQEDECEGVPVTRVVTTYRCACGVSLTVIEFWRYPVVEQAELF
jgi:hypothetical protein